MSSAKSSTKTKTRTTSIVSTTTSSNARRKLDIEKVFKEFVVSLSESHPNDINSLQRDQFLAFTRNEILSTIKHAIHNRSVADIDFMQLNKIYRENPKSHKAIRSYLNLFTRFCEESANELANVPAITLDHLRDKIMPAISDVFDNKFLSLMTESIPMLSFALPTIMNFDFSNIDVQEIEPKEGEEFKDTVRRFVNSQQFDTVSEIFMDKFKLLSNMLPALSSSESLSGTPLINSKILNEVMANFKMPQQQQQQMNKN